MPHDDENTKTIHYTVNTRHRMFKSLREMIVQYVRLNQILIMYWISWKMRTRYI